MSIHKQCITWYKVKRINVFNKLWRWEASAWHMLKIHTHTHKAHHKYAFVPLLVWGGSWKHIKCHSLYFHLTFIGSAWSVHTTGSKRLSVYEEMLEYAPYMQHFPPECDATKGWQMLQWMEASDPVEPHRKVVGQGELGGEKEREREKSDGTCSFIHPFTPVATATCLEGTQERRHCWQKQQRGRELVRATDSKTTQTACSNGSRKQGHHWLRLLVPSQRGANLTFGVPAKKHNEHPFITGGHSDYCQNRSAEVLPTATTSTFTGVNITDIPSKKDTIMRYEIGRVNQTEANA